MGFIELIILSFALAADSFSVGMAYGVRHNTKRQVFRLSLHFGVFQSLMTFAGILAGTLLLKIISAWDHWLVLFFLCGIGVHMIIQSFKSPEVRNNIKDLTRGWSMIASSLAVSVDALGAGIGLRAADANLPLALFMIGAVSFTMTFAGMNISRKISQILARRAELVAGIILIALGVQFLLDDLNVI